MSILTGLRSAKWGLVAGIVATSAFFRAKKTSNPLTENVAGIAHATMGAAISTTLLGVIESTAIESAKIEFLSTTFGAARSTASGMTIALASNTVGILAQSPTATTQEKMLATATTILAVGLVVIETREMVDILGSILTISLVLRIGMMAKEISCGTVKAVTERRITETPTTLLVGSGAALIIAAEAVAAVSLGIFFNYLF